MLKNYKVEKVAEIISEYYSQKICNLLVVGCGNGIEAAILAIKLKANVIGIDIENRFDSIASNYASLKIGDAKSLKFEDNFFDFVYSNHVLEHIDDPVKALLEMRRVLKKGGGYWIGTPNKNRLIGYIGSKTTIKQKIIWNIKDYKMRLMGRFENKFGAHAGFSIRELECLLGRSFATVQNMTDVYYLKLYPK